MLIDLAGLPLTTAAIEVVHARLAMHALPEIVQLYLYARERMPDSGVGRPTSSSLADNEHCARFRVLRLATMRTFIAEFLSSDSSGSGP